MLSDTTRAVLLEALEYRKKQAEGERDWHMDNWRKAPNPKEAVDEAERRISRLATAIAEVNAEAEWEDVPDGKYSDGLEIETPQNCRKAIVTYCGDSLGIIKRRLWIPSNIRIQLRTGSQPEAQGEADYAK